jgi:hypothetical protein
MVIVSKSIYHTRAKEIALNYWSKLRKASITVPLRLRNESRCVVI